MPRAPHIRDWLSLLALTALWGSAFLFNELALASFSPSVLVSGRILIATVLIYAYLRVTGESLPRPGRAWMPMVVLAVFGNVLPFHLIAWAQLHIESSLAGILMAVMPLVTLVLAHLFVDGERLNRSRLVGFLTGFCGIVILVGPEAVLELEGGGSTLLSELAVLAGAVC